MRHSITGRGRESNLSPGKFIWPWKSWQQMLKGNGFICLQIDAVEAMCFIVALMYVRVILFWQQLMGLHIVSVGFCFFYNFMGSWNDYIWTEWLRVWKVCVSNCCVIHCKVMLCIVTQGVKKLTCNIKTASPACDLGLPEQRLLTSLMWHFECLGLFCEWEFNHHIINGFGVGPVIHDTVLYSFARNLRAEMRRL